MTDVPHELGTALADLREWHESLVAQVRDGIDLPAPDLELDLESRESVDRQARHIHQMCSLHHAHFTVSTQFKMPYLTSAYIWAADNANPFGLYSATRALVEFSAFTHEVSRRLQNVVARGGDWRTRGEAYFDVIVKARFGTGDSKLVEEVRERGYGGDETGLPKPIHINDGLRSLAKVERFVSVMDDYERLCDFVHHNLSSQASAAEGYYVSARSAKTARGGEFRTPSTGPMIRYRYPARSAVEEAIKWTAPIAFTHSRAVVEWHNAIPSTPFLPEELVELTGSELGFVVLTPTAPVFRQTKKTRRNEPCPCGSGKKYKRCHGAAGGPNEPGSTLIASED